MPEETRPAGLPDYDESPAAGGATSTMSVNGIDLTELQAAHAQLPTLARWHETSIQLIPELYDLVKQGRAIATGQALRIGQLETEIERLREKCEPEGVGEPQFDPLDTPEEAAFDPLAGPGEADLCGREDPEAPNSSN